MNKEINAINSENEKNLNNDLWRQYQLIKTMSNSEYSFHKFSTGNNETLRMISPDSLNKRLIDFFNKNYITTNMRLVVLGIIIYNNNTYIYHSFNLILIKIKEV